MEVLIELIGQIFGELILQGLAHLLASLFKVFETNSALKRKIKYTIVYVFFALVLGLLIFSVLTKTGLYIQVVLIYLIIMLFVHFFKFINRNILNNKFHQLIRIITSILHYALAVILIMVADLNANTNSSIVIIVISLISILIFIIIDIFRIIRAFKQKKRLKQNR